MARRHHYRKRHEQADLDVTTFLSLMVVLIPFLLVTAVFSRITIQELNLPSQATSQQPQEQLQAIIEVIIRRAALQITDGEKITDTIEKTDAGKYDIKKLSERLLELKQMYPEKKDAIVLVEPDIEYEALIHVMDTVKQAEVLQEDVQEWQKMELFPQISLGDAP